MVRIEIKRLNKEELIFGVEAENETPADVVVCVLYGVVGVARKVMGKESAAPPVCETDGPAVGGTVAPTRRRTGRSLTGG